MHLWNAVAGADRSDLLVMAAAALALLFAGLLLIRAFRT